MKKILITLIITFGFIHAEEWIYYCSNYILARINPDGLENEILMESNVPTGYHLADISLDKTKLLYIKGIAAPSEEVVSLDLESMDTQVTYLNPELPPPLAEIYFPEGFYFPEGASFTDNENEIIFIEDQYLYKYSFLDSSVTLLIENENGWGEVGHNNIKNISQSPDKTKIAYMEADSDSSHLIVFDIQNNETSVLGTFSTPYDGCSQKQVYWSTGDYILFSICDMNDLSNLFKIHSSNGESAQLIENEIFNIMETRESPLEKLVYTKNSQCPTCYRIIDLESNEISDPDNNMQYEYNGSSLNWYSQAWSPDHSKVVMAGVYADSSYYPYLPYSSFLYIYNISTDSFTATTGTNYFIPVFWVGESDVSVDEPADNFPREFVLYSNYPNPFNPTTTLQYDLPEDAHVSIMIFDLMGREIRTLINKQQSAGIKSIMWDGTNDLGQPLSAGMYLYRISAGDFHSVKKMVLLK
jgi:hypothetical protein